jgi:4-amino-4-deoxy-L-arabinose transferase-like glycosyltransferase
MSVDSSRNGEKLFDAGLIILLIMVLAKLLVHLWTNYYASYGIFRDEFYYLACSHRLDLGYVDQPPLSIYILALSRNIFGDSLFALRLVPALAGATTVLVTGLMVRKLGGRTAAMVIACLAVMAAPVYWGMNTFYSMNCFDILLWTLAAYIMIFVIKENRPKHWISLGVVIGLGLLNKTEMIWFCFGLFVAVLLTRQRKNLSTKWPYMTALIAVLLFLPYVIWNFLHDFAHMEFIRNAMDWKYSSLSPKGFIVDQLLNMQPATLPIWLAGLFFLFSNKEGGRLRPLGIIYVTAFLILIINGRSKAEYLSPAYTMLFASGAVQIES